MDRYTHHYSRWEITNQSSKNTDLIVMRVVFSACAVLKDAGQPGKYIFYFGFNIGSDYLSKFASDFPFAFPDPVCDLKR